MPVTVPPYLQQQVSPPPLRGLWNKPPPEGDRFVNYDVVWGGGATPQDNAVQVNLQSGSTTIISQIVAIYVDNSRCGATASFVFIDTGFVLDVAPGAQGLYPVFTNALAFYAVASGALAGDETIFQVFNSMPPPISIPPALAQQVAGVQGIPLQTNGVTQVVPAGINGTIEGININISAAGAGSAVISLVDGASQIIYQMTLALTAAQNVNIPLTGLNRRFKNGITCQISGTTFTGTWVVVNVYYSRP